MTSSVTSDQAQTPGDTRHGQYDGNMLCMHTYACSTNNEEETEFIEMKYWVQHQLATRISIHSEKKHTGKALIGLITGSNRPISEGRMMR